MLRRSKKLAAALTLLFVSGLLNFKGININAEELNKNSYKRISGSNRIETSINISKSNWTKNSDEVIISYAYGFADSLCAVPLAKMYKAPILLSGKNKLDADVLNEVKRLSPKHITIVGGNGVIGKEIQDQLSKIAKVQRIGGKNRYETSVKLAEKLSNVSKVTIATGSDFPDALSIAPIAAMKGMPILLSNKNNIPNVVSKYIAKNKINSAYIVGGKGVLSENIDKRFSNSIRLAGNDRYDTNIKIINEFKKDLNLNKVYFATAAGKNSFADALTGASVATITLSPLVLTDKGLPQVTHHFITKNMKSDTKLVVLGGNAAVPDKVINDVISIINKKEDSIKDNNKDSNNHHKHHHNNNPVNPASVKISVPQEKISDKGITIDSIVVKNNTVTINGNCENGQAVVKILRPNKSVLFVDVPTMNKNEFTTTVTFDGSFEIGDYTTIIGQDSNIVNFKINVFK